MIEIIYVVLRNGADVVKYYNFINKSHMIITINVLINIIFIPRFKIDSQFRGCVFMYQLTPKWKTYSNIIKNTLFTGIKRNLCSFNNYEKERFINFWNIIFAQFYLISNYLT